MSITVQIVLNSGLGILFLGVPIILILSTFFVAFIEALYLKKYNQGLWKTIKKLIVANFITTLIGIIFIIILNIGDGGDNIVDLITNRMAVKKKSFPYYMLLNFMVLFPNYLLSVLCELKILKRILTPQLTIKDTAIANGITYGLLFVFGALFALG